jgi:hypothetical protein
MRDALDVIENVIQQDVGGRGLRTDPASNLLTASAGDFRAACQSVAGHPHPALAVITGFFIPHADPPADETDGPLGALFLARALTPLGMRVALVTDASGRRALEAGLAKCGLAGTVPLRTLPPPGPAWPAYVPQEWLPWCAAFSLTHLIALERVGPSHTEESLRRQGASEETLRQFLQEVPAEHRDRCHNMRGRDISDHTSPAHLLFEAVQGRPGITTLGIGDGGNEIGMGKVPWQVIRRNIARGGLIACRVPGDHLIVAGVSNWGAYGLAAGIYHLRGLAPPRDLFNSERERELLEWMVQQGPLVDGVTGRPTATVDGLSFERYAAPLAALPFERSALAGG